MDGWLIARSAHCMHNLEFELYMEAMSSKNVSKCKSA
jgi:hypothetical protein